MSVLVTMENFQFTNSDMQWFTSSTKNYQILNIHNICMSALRRLPEEEEEEKKLRNQLKFLIFSFRIQFHHQYRSPETNINSPKFIFALKEVTKKGLFLDDKPLLKNILNFLVNNFHEQLKLYVLSSLEDGVFNKDYEAGSLAISLLTKDRLYDIGDEHNIIDLISLNMSNDKNENLKALLYYLPALITESSSSKKLLTLFQSQKDLLAQSEGIPKLLTNFLHSRTMASLGWKHEEVTSLIEAGVLLDLKEQIIVQGEVLQLIPNAESIIIKQGKAQDCYLLTHLYGMLSTPIGMHKLLQIIAPSTNGNVILQFNVQNLSKLDLTFSKKNVLTQKGYTLKEKVNQLMISVNKNRLKIINDTNNKVTTNSFFISIMEDLFPLIALKTIIRNTQEMHKLSSRPANDGNFDETLGNLFDMHCQNVYTNSNDVDGLKNVLINLKENTFGILGFSKHAYVALPGDNHDNGSGIMVVNPHNTSQKEYISAEKLIQNSFDFDIWPMEFKE